MEREEFLAISRTRPIWQKHARLCAAQSIGFTVCSLCGNDRLRADKRDYALCMECIGVFQNNALF